MTVTEEQLKKLIKDTYNEAYDCGFNSAKDMIKAGFQDLINVMEGNPLEKLDISETLLQKYLSKKLEGEER